MTLAIAQELRARLRPRHAALRAMGQLYKYSDIEPAWWPSEGGAQVGLWWLNGSVPARWHDVDPRTICLRDAAEALVLLGALARADYKQCARALSEVWSLRRVDPITRPVEIDGDSVQHLVVGVQYTICRLRDLAPISERVVGIDEPTPEFLEEFAWLERQDFAARLRPLRPIPVRLLVALDEDEIPSLAFCLRQIVQNVVTQQLHSPTSRNGEPSTLAVAATSSRFEIVEVVLDLDPSVTVNLEALEHLTRLIQRGIRVQCLPSIRVDPAFSSLSVMKSLHALLPPRHDPSTSSSIHYVFVTNRTSPHLIPGFFTAIVACQAVKALEILVLRDMPEGNEFPSATISVWKWGAYVLFSRHAAQHVTEARIHVETLDHRALDAIKEVLDVENPLAGLFKNVLDDGQWIYASEFYAHSPQTSPSEAAPMFRSVEPMHVRVLGRFETGGIDWRKIVLPGYGEAWAKPAEVTEIKSHNLQLFPDSTRSPSSQSALRLVLENVDSSNKHRVISLLRLVHRDINSIEHEYADSLTAEFDVTEWTAELLRVVPALEHLKLPDYAEVQRLHIFVEAAEAGQCRLRSLSLSNDVNIESSGVVEFLEVLCDATHPFTHQLEDLHFAVHATAALPPEFVAAWRRVLQCNRTLHTISITVRGPECVDADFDEQVAIRTGPLSISSKLAFLSATYDLRASHKTSYSARSRLDTSVLATIFAFAAPHRLRKILIEYDPL